jgi:hypothetical protein
MHFTRATIAATSAASLKTNLIVCCCGPRLAHVGPSRAEKYGDTDDTTMRWMGKLATTCSALLTPPQQ